MRYVFVRIDERVCVVIGWIDFIFCFCMVMWGFDVVFESDGIVYVVIVVGYVDFEARGVFRVFFGVRFYFFLKL